LREQSEVDEELDMEAKERWSDESPAPEPNPEIVPEDPDDSPLQPDDEA
jgi:hypothetical protein